MDSLNQIEGQEGLYITKKAKVTHIINEYSNYYAVKNCETKEIKVKEIENGR